MKAPRLGQTRSQMNEVLFASFSFRKKKPSFLLSDLARRQACSARKASTSGRVGVESEQLRPAMVREAAAAA